jgi:hypothetical protein
VDTRNYLTHFSSELEGRRLRGNQLYTVTEFLDYILVFHILRMLNVPHDTVWQTLQIRLSHIQSARFMSL